MTEAFPYNVAIQSKYFCAVFCSVFDIYNGGERYIMNLKIWLVVDGPAIAVLSIDNLSESKHGREMSREDELMVRSNDACWKSQKIEAESWRERTTKTSWNEKMSVRADKKDEKMDKEMMRKLKQDGS